MNKQSVAILALYCFNNMEEVQKTFRMNFFCTNDERNKIIDPIRHSCGTVGCFAGNGPRAGLLAKVDDFNWYLYIERVFGLTGDDANWDFLFNACWPNKVYEAVKRASWLLEDKRLFGFNMNGEFTGEEIPFPSEWLEYEPNIELLTTIAKG